MASHQGLEVSSEQFTDRCDDQHGVSEIVNRVRLISISSLVTLMALTASAATGPGLERALADPDGTMEKADGTLAVWVHFTDRGLTGADLDAAIVRSADQLSPRALARRAKVKAPGEPLVSERDLAPATSYMSSVIATGARARQQSRWLNAASFDATREQITAIAALPFVREVTLVRRFVRDTSEEGQHQEITIAELDALKSAAENRHSLNYGGTLPGAEQINLPPVHDQGLSGQGIVIGMLDAGYLTTHLSFRNLDIIAAWDFVNDDDDVGQEPDDPYGSADHGTQTLSMLAAFEEGEIVGSAYGASVILAKTEDISVEVPAEEDNWVAGIEWIESLGADVVTSSTGYYYWYDYSDLDGNTALCTIAADLAVGHGISVFNIAGNQRQDSEFPHIIAPADGDSVITVGAVDIDGFLAEFSSPGPTYDGRIKPDLMANGVKAHAVAYWNDDGYMTATGTSFATPFLAGVAALMLERLPDLTPIQIREALRETADNVNRPDNDYGWGIVDALAALNYYGPVIVHTPLNTTEDTVGPYVIDATITSRTPLDDSSLMLNWRIDGGPWQSESLIDLGDDAYSATIPGQPGGSLVEYYLTAGDTDGIVLHHPLSAPTTVHGFIVELDTTPPTVTHVALMTQTPVIWPPTVRATVSDNLGIDRVELTYQVNGGGTAGPFPLDLVDDHHELVFPLESVQTGDQITYQITAYDIASNPNSTAHGPHPVAVNADLGSVLVIDNGLSAAMDVTASADLITTWLNQVGYEAEQVSYLVVGEQDLAGRAAVVLSCGSNGAAAGSSSLRSLLVNWTRQGGRILVEGGELARPTFDWPTYPVFGAEVLRSVAYAGDLQFTFYPATLISDHPFLNRPNLMLDPLEMDIPDGSYNTDASDMVIIADEALAVIRPPYNPNWAGVVTYDDNSAIEAGQNVYITFDVSYLEDTVGRDLLENAMSYLTAPEPPGGATIAGTVTLVDGADAEGTTISCRHSSTTTDSDGQYELAGLYGGTHTMTVSRPGYAPIVQSIDLVDDQYLGEVDFQLFPVIELNYSLDPALPIPDYDPDGVTSVITVDETGPLLGITVDIDIQHNYIGHLEVTLTSPAGTSVTLHDNSGSGADDLVGNWPTTLSVDGPGTLQDFFDEDVQGDWTLFVADTGFGVWGSLESWGLNIMVGTTITAVTPENEVPLATGLVGNAPNPFNPMTMIAFNLAQAGHVRLDVHDVRGRRVRQLMSGTQAAGQHQVRWDGRDDGGREMASGTYFCRLVTDKKSEVHKMALVR